MGLALERGLEELEKRGFIYQEGNLNCMDVFFAPSIPWFTPTKELFRFNLLEREKCPCLHKWIQSLLTNELVKLTLQDGGKLI
ncbi:hypothetical protein SUGI_0414780 [Cryptomeria japonica]|nr:hypothetical protein SUGI_0414780 [Cryptomeria japonica]